MKTFLFLDDERRPWGTEWHLVKTYDECVRALQEGGVEHLSLDHDLAAEHYSEDLGSEKTGYHVILWMAENGVWPSKTLIIHTMNPVGRQRMVSAAERYAPKDVFVSTQIASKNSDGEYVAGNFVKLITNRGES